MSARSGGLFVGRLAAEAGVGILLEALDAYPGARVDIVGAGPEAARLRDHPRVRLLGRVASDELRSRMQRAAYLVLPSLSYDAEPQALVMAFAEALPVIASRLARIAELVEPGRNGLLFEPGSARDLARRLAWAEAFPEKMRQMGECAQADYQARFVADWNWRRLYGERRRQARQIRGQTPIS
jgi:glycosyltransferase involved in cell wall biosynthesis